MDPTSVPTTLAPLPQLSRVSAKVFDGNVIVDFFPVDGAKDYRIYPLPNNADVSTDGSGVVTVKNATYRCAGDRQTPTTGFSATAQDPTKNIIGYGYADPGAGRSPVYVVSGPAYEEQGWAEERIKVYTLSSTERDQLVSQRWMDRGIAFYVPSASSPSTKPVYTTHSEDIVAGQGWTHLVRTYSDKSSTGAVSVFPVLAAPTTGALPIRTVAYAGRADHTEVTIGDAQFERASKQGNTPYWKLSWTGLTAPTTLVVEALDQGCPFQGFLSPQHLDATPNHQALLTIDDLRKASASTEVFVNGQHAATNRPKPMARSFVQVSPAPAPAMDWSSNFATSPTFASVPYSADMNSVRYQSTDYDLIFNRLDPGAKGMQHAFGALLGEFWVAYSDFGADTVGRMRLTAKQKAQMSSTSFLHTRMAVDTVTTGRRYPQIILSDQDAPVQDKLAQSRTILIQQIQGPSGNVEVQAFKNFAWDVNNQFSAFPIAVPDQYNDAVPPRVSPAELSALDKVTQFDVYASTASVYVFVDGMPLGCAKFPPAVAATTPIGPVTVTFGDVLYHEGAADEVICDQPMPYGFMHLHQCTETKRQFSNLGFKSGVAAPAWDEQRIPCSTQAK